MLSSGPEVESKQHKHKNYRNRYGEEEDRYPETFRHEYRADNSKAAKHNKLYEFVDNQTAAHLAYRPPAVVGQVTNFE
jgi:hypothetical protein